MMPSLLSPPDGHITKLTNCRLVKGNDLVRGDLWISSITGKILCGQEIFYGERVMPDRVINLGNRIVSPGLIDVQLNGAFGTNFSEVPQNLSTFSIALSKVNKSLVRTGVTSYLPTMTSQTPETFHKLLPHLGPSGHQRKASDGSESLGAHCEGPFLNPTKNGIHPIDVLRTCPNGFADLEDCYGTANLISKSEDGKSLAPLVRMVTAAPELEGMMEVISELKSQGIIFSIGHSEANFEEASAAVSAGATMITHLFNAMRPLHHRNPGIFGVLGTAETEAAKRPFFGVISDGIHLHPSSIKLAFNMHPEGCILVTDAMQWVGLEDGIYEWTNGERIIKTGPRLTLEGSDKIAGSSISLLECLNNFTRWTGASLPQALKTVTSSPARMLGLEGVKGSLEEGADADLVIFSESCDAGDLVIDQVWKFGCQVYDRCN